MSQQQSASETAFNAEVLRQLQSLQALVATEIQQRKAMELQREQERAERAALDEQRRKDLDGIRVDLKRVEDMLRTFATQKDIEEAEDRGRKEALEEVGMQSGPGAVLFRQQPEETWGCIAKQNFRLIVVCATVLIAVGIAAGLGPQMIQAVTQRMAK